MPCEASVPWWYLGGRRAVRVERCGMVMRGYDVATQPLGAWARRCTDGCADLGVPRSREQRKVLQKGSEPHISVRPLSQTTHNLCALSVVLISLLGPTSALCATMSRLPTRLRLYATPLNGLMTARNRCCSTAIPVPKPLHLLLYTYTDNALEKRAPHRTAHLAAARAAELRGQLLLGGALADPLDGGVLLFAGGREVAEEFATSDPYTQNGIVTDWTVREWTVVVGSMFAQLPAPPPFVPKYEWQAELHHGHFDQAELPAGLEITLPLDRRPWLKSLSARALPTLAATAASSRCRARHGSGALRACHRPDG